MFSHRLAGGITIARLKSFNNESMLASRFPHAVRVGDRDRLSPFTSAVTALGLVSAAYTAEIFRAGIEAVPSGQFEASAALGLSNRHTMIDVILPQAIRIVIPPLTNNSINVLKDTALASVVAMPDLLKQATQAQALAANPTPLIGAAIIYILLLCPMVLLVSRLEKHLNRGKR